MPNKSTTLVCIRCLRKAGPGQQPQCTTARIRWGSQFMPYCEKRRCRDSAGWNRLSASPPFCPPQSRRYSQCCQDVRPGGSAGKDCLLARQRPLYYLCVLCRDSEDFGDGLIVPKRRQEAKPDALATIFCDPGGSPDMQQEGRKWKSMWASTCRSRLAPSASSIMAAGCCTS